MMHWDGALLLLRVRAQRGLVFWQAAGNEAAQKVLHAVGWHHTLGGSKTHAASSLITHRIRIQSNPRWCQDKLSGNTPLWEIQTLGCVWQRRKRGEREVGREVGGGKKEGAAIFIWWRSWCFLFWVWSHDAIINTAQSNLKAYCAGHQALELPNWVKFKHEAEVLGCIMREAAVSSPALPWMFVTTVKLGTFWGKPSFWDNPVLVYIICLRQPVLLGFSVMKCGNLTRRWTHFPSLLLAVTRFLGFPWILFDKPQARAWWISDEGLLSACSLLDFILHGCSTSNNSEPNTWHQKLFAFDALKNSRRYFEPSRLLVNVLKLSQCDCCAGRFKHTRIKSDRTVISHIRCFDLSVLTYLMWMLEKGDVPSSHPPIRATFESKQVDSWWVSCSALSIKSDHQTLTD